MAQLDTRAGLRDFPRYTKDVDVEIFLEKFELACGLSTPAITDGDTNTKGKLVLHCLDHETYALMKSVGVTTSSTYAEVAKLLTEYFKLLLLLLRRLLLLNYSIISANACRKTRKQFAITI